ncbi:MAG: exodeoxyribonuclease VII small subunit [Clostridia bacterium]|nr:exodeoxyribonuclease VII small subunit [Clostridia bacterium]
MSFEKALKELEETVKKLESGDTTLEEAITLFEKGVGLTKECRKKLDEAQMKVKMITENGEEKDFISTEA